MTKSLSVSNPMHPDRIGRRIAHIEKQLTEVKQLYRQQYQQVKAVNHHKARAQSRLAVNDATGQADTRL
jgi:F0F1-type ATP synthase membrane subunit b/b'